jgi:hypothetical protein
MSLKQELEVLRPIFAEIEHAKLKLLAFMCERVSFDHGNPLIQQRDLPDAAYRFSATAFSSGEGFLRSSRLRDTAC